MPFICQEIGTKLNHTRYFYGFWMVYCLVFLHFGHWYFQRCISRLEIGFMNYFQNAKTLIHQLMWHQTHDIFLDWYINSTWIWDLNHMMEFFYNYENYESHLFYFLLKYILFLFIKMYVFIGKLVSSLSFSLFLQRNFHIFCSKHSQLKDFLISVLIFLLWPLWFF